MTVMPDTVEITVRGKPAPQGSKRHIGGGRMIEVSKAVGPWREAVRAETQRAMASRCTFTGAVHLQLLFVQTRPVGHFRTGRYAHLLRPGAPTHPAGKPDIDKLARAVMDGLTEGGAWKDDSQVVVLRAEKMYAIGDTPGCVIRIWGVDLCTSPS